MAGRPKGGKKYGGRAKGTPNKVNKAVKDMVLGALDTLGGEDYLVEQARTNPNAFLTLVGKVIPTQLTGESGGAIEVIVRRGAVGDPED